jgi:hypothetical protein
MLGFESIYLFLSFKKHRKRSVWMFLKVILNANQVHRLNSKGTRRDFNDFGNLTAELITIIAHPLSVAEDVGILFTFCQIIILIGIKTRGGSLRSSGSSIEDHKNRQHYHPNAHQSSKNSYHPHPQVGRQVLCYCSEL